MNRTGSTNGRTRYGNVIVDNQYRRVGDFLRQELDPETLPPGGVLLLLTPGLIRSRWGADLPPSHPSL